MPQLFTCPRGHQWESAEGVTTPFHCPNCGESPSSAVDLAPESTRSMGGDALPPRPQPIFPVVPGYEVLGPLGRGGMGVVYKARQLSLNRIVALKMILAGAEVGPDEAARFRAEAESVGRLQHPHIVQIFEAGKHQGRLFFSMEYMEGGGLNRRTARRPQPPREAAALVETLARAMDHAHRRGVVHRDLKPANVLLTAEGLPKVADFGLAKRTDVSGWTAAGSVLGTPAYMAPEQADGLGDRIGPKADVWALGAILYEMLTGGPPFAAETPMQTLAQVLNKEPVPPRRLNPEVPALLETICLKCLRKNPDHRYPTASALADDLRNYLEGPAKTPRRRVPFLPLAAAAAALLLLPAVLIFLFAWRGGVAATGGEPYWEPLAVGGDDVFQRIAFPTRSVGYVAGRRSVYKSTDGGRTWRRLRQTDAPLPVHELLFRDEKTGWLASDRLWETADGGESWSPADLPGVWRSVRGVAVGDDGRMAAGGVSAAGELVLARRDRAGSAWKAIRSDKIGLDMNRPWLLTDLAILSGQTAAAAVCVPPDEEGTILGSEDGGASWRPIGPNGGVPYCVGPAGRGRLFAAGLGGGMWSTEDFGRNWRSVPTAATETITRLAFDRRGSGFGLAPLWNGAVLTTPDGEKWGQTHVDAGYSTPDAAVVDAGWAYVLGSDGRIAHYVDPRVKGDK